MPCTCGEVACECKEQCHCRPESCHCYECDLLRELARRGYDRTHREKYSCIGCELHPPSPTDERNPSSEKGPTDDLMFQMDDIDGVPQASTSAQRKADDSAGCSSNNLRVNSERKEGPPSPQWSYNPNYVSPLPSSGDSGVELNPRVSRVPEMPISPDFSRCPGHGSSATISESGECKAASVPRYLPEALPEAGSSKEKSNTRYSSEKSPTLESVGMETLTVSDDPRSSDKQGTLAESSSSVDILPDSSESGLTSESPSVTTSESSSSVDILAESSESGLNSEPRSDSSEAPASNSGVSSARRTSAQSGSCIEALHDTEQSSEDSEPTDPSKEPE